MTLTEPQRAIAQRLTDELWKKFPGANAEMWGNAFAPIVERLVQEAREQEREALPSQIEVLQAARAVEDAAYVLAPFSNERKALRRSLRRAADLLRSLLRIESVSDQKEGRNEQAETPEP